VGPAVRKVLPSMRAMQIGMSRLACHTSLRSFGLHVPRTVVCMSAASAERSTALLAGRGFRAMVCVRRPVLATWPKQLDFDSRLTTTRAVPPCQEDAGGRIFARGAAAGAPPRPMHTAEELLAALDQASPSPIYPVLLQEWPSNGGGDGGTTTTATTDCMLSTLFRANFVHHKLHSIVAVGGPRAGDPTVTESLRARAGPTIDALSKFLEMNDIEGVCQVEFSADVAQEDLMCACWGCLRACLGRACH
jgi:hypothetical protein